MLTRHHCSYSQHRNSSYKTNDVIKMFTFYFPCTSQFLSLSLWGKLNVTKYCDKNQIIALWNWNSRLYVVGHFARQTFTLLLLSYFGLYTTVAVSKQLLCFHLYDVFLFRSNRQFSHLLLGHKGQNVTHTHKKVSMQFVREAIFFIGSMYSLDDCKQNGQNVDTFQTIKPNAHFKDVRFLYVNFRRKKAAKNCIYCYFNRTRCVQTLNQTIKNETFAKSWDIYWRKMVNFAYGYKITTRMTHFSWFVFILCIVFCGSVVVYIDSPDAAVFQQIVKHSNYFMSCVTNWIL